MDEPLKPVAIASRCCNRILFFSDGLPDGVVHDGNCREKNGGMLGPTLRLVVAPEPRVTEAEARDAFGRWFFAHPSDTPTRYECWLAAAKWAGKIKGE